MFRIKRKNPRTKIMKLEIKKSDKSIFRKHVVSVVESDESDCDIHEYYACY